MMTGDPVVSATLNADAAFAGGATEAASAYQWFHADKPGGVPLSRERTYTLTYDDLGHEVVVHVTPITPGGATGELKRAHTNHPIAISAEVKDKLQEWYQLSQKSFPGCLEGDKEWTILFTQKNLKLRDKKGTQAKSDPKDGYTTVAIELSPTNARGFSLSIGGKKGTSAQHHLLAPNAIVRDLIALTYAVFAHPTTLESIPVVATSSPSLLANAVGVLTTSRGGGGESPASSVTAENPNLAEVDDASSKSGKSASSKLASAGRKLSFARAGKKK